MRWTNSTPRKSRQHSKPQPPSLASKSARSCIRRGSPSPGVTLARVYIISSKFSGKRGCAPASIARWRGNTGFQPVLSTKHPCSVSARLGRLGSLPDESSKMRELLELRPSVSQRDRPVPHLLLSRGIRIEREIAETLELIALVQAARPLSAGSHFAATIFERVRIEIRLEIAARRRAPGTVKSRSYKSDLRVDRVRCAYPVNRAFDFAIRGRAAGLALEIDTCNAARSHCPASSLITSSHLMM